jgi:N-acetylglucosamine kinase-like BadF-type ATPase
MAYLIADSGATKTEWRLAGNTNSEIFFTEGLHPYYHTTDSIEDVLSEHLIPKLNERTVDKIYFYGAGCDRSERNAIVEKALQTHFPDADTEIKEDQMAAARACFFDKPGIPCILGTGSNSCLYDGNTIIEHIPPLGFILGDEGSAAYFGKKLINHYFRNEVPDSLKEKLEQSFNMSLAHIMHDLYHRPQQSRFIASYSKFLGNHEGHPFIKKMLREGFKAFINRIVKKYTNAAAYEVGFVGSVACAHQSLIEEILQEEGLKSGPFIQEQMDQLVEYHLTQ